MSDYGGSRPYRSRGSTGAGAGTIYDTPRPYGNWGQPLPPAPEADPRSGLYDGPRPYGPGGTPLPGQPTAPSPPPSPSSPPTPPTGPSTPPTPPSVDPSIDLGNKDALARLQTVLSQYGLGSMSDWAWQRIVNGESQDEILQDLRQTAEYKQRFQGMAVRQQNGYNAISEADYINYENTARGLLRGAGLPSGFYDTPDDFVRLIGSDVSPVELKARIDNGITKALQAPPEIRQAFGQFYGVNGDANLTAYFLDPDKAEPVLERQVQAATLAGTGDRFNIGISKDMAETLAQKGLTQGDAESGFGKLADLQPLFNDSVSEQSPLRADVEGAEAVFGLGQGAQQQIEQRQKSRQAAFAGGGGASEQTTGVTGLGSARSY